MKKTDSIFCLFLTFLFSCNNNTEYEWIVTTQESLWETNDVTQINIVSEGTPDAILETENAQQTIDGFGACFNELGWTSLNLLDEVSRNAVLDELFTPGKGGNFTICRMPVGANDFSRDWYSYNETDNDFEMNNFSIDNDKETLIPFIKHALQYNPNLKIWASPWSPPTWMKDNKYYACKPTSSFFDQRYANSIKPDQIRDEGMDMFIQEDAYYKAYALYFRKFIESYRAAGINIFMIMPQNEFNSCQPFPSCTWKVSGLATFIGKYLGPQMKELGVEVMFGTMERPNPLMVDTILNDPDCKKYITGVGFQWAGKRSIGDIHKRYPQMAIYQTEQECGDGKNNWRGCVYSWNLMKHYFNNGTNVYDYWNLSLEEGGMSRWGWTQNSLVTVDTLNHTYKYTYEYYLLKHASHFVKQGAKYIPVSGDYKDLIAFQNPDGQYIILLYNSEKTETKRIVQIKKTKTELTLKPESINTICIKH